MTWIIAIGVIVCGFAAYGLVALIDIHAINRRDE